MAEGKAGDMSAERRVRVVIAEDHAVVREGTRQILERDPAIDVVGEAEDGERALSLCGELQPDVLVLDLHLPKVNGIQVARSLGDVSPGTRTLVLSAYDDRDYLLASMEAGVAGYLLKTTHGGEVIAAIHAIVKGGIVLDPQIAPKLLADREVAAERGPGGQLTERELEILNLAGRGLHNKEIARELQLSTRTVEGHLSHIFNKLNVDSRTEAVLMGISQGWLTLAEDR